MSTQTRRSEGIGGNVLVLAVIVAGLGVLMWLYNTEREVALRKSAVGLDGLLVWLRDNGQPARAYTGWEQIDPDDIALRVQVLYDADPARKRREPADEKALLAQESEDDVETAVLREKIMHLPTLLVLPKWRTGMRLTRVAHPDLLNETTGLAALLDDLVERPGTFAAPTGDFRTFPADFGGDSALEATLYLPRALKGSDCEPLVGDRDAMILGTCFLKVPEGKNLPGWAYDYFYLLTDPDLLDAHGLRLGDNADVAAAAIAYLSDEYLTVVDYTNESWVERRAEGGERSWADLLRFFADPFTILWIGLAATMALFLWRAAVRYGAPIRVFRDGLHIAKGVSVDATARLLRLSGHDDSLVSEFIRQRIELAAAEIFGPHRITADPLGQLVTWLEPRDAELAHALAESAAERPGTDPLQRLDDLESTLSKVLHDFGRTPRHG